jgi:hypothetical protein
MTRERLFIDFSQNDDVALRLHPVRSVYKRTHTLQEVRRIVVVKYWQRAANNDRS